MCVPILLDEVEIMQWLEMVFKDRPAKTDAINYYFNIRHNFQISVFYS